MEPLKLNIEPQVASPAAASKQDSPQVTIDATGADISTGPLTEPIDGDWSRLLLSFGLDPSLFEVVDDTVRISKWQQSKRTEDGDRDMVWLYSYKARFRRRLAPVDTMADLDEVVARVNRWKVARNAAQQGFRQPVTYVHHQGDEQAGKSEGGGLDGLRQREEEALQRSYDSLRAFTKSHYVTEVLDVASGDRAENIFGHYNSQARTTATLRNQFRFSREMDLKRTEMLCSFGLPVRKVYTTSNHGELRQAVGQSPYTSESDNLDLMIAEMVKEVIDRSELRDQVIWHIPHDQWWTTFTSNGVVCGITHGHKAGKTRLDRWVRDQRDYLHFHHGVRMQLALLGHMHHLYVEDVGGTVIIQTPSLDGGSPYFEQASGSKAAHGSLSYLIGEQYRLGYSHLTVI